MPVTAMRDWIASQVRDRVAGSNRAARAGDIFDAPGPRWFPADAPIRVVHADAAMFVGGLRALLLQSLHPLAMAGVAEHSAYREDPWARLQRTADFLAVTTYGPDAEAARAVERVRRVHDHVRGIAPDGRPYSANDPHLLRWVHLAEVDSFLRAHDRYGAEPLRDTDRDGYVRDMARIARALGVPAPPESVRAVADQLRGFRHELRGTTQARDAARFLILDPPLPTIARPAYGLITAAAVSLLPSWARRPLRLPQVPVTEAVAIRPASALLIRTLRWALEPGATAPAAAS